MSYVALVQLIVEILSEIVGVLRQISRPFWCRRRQVVERGFFFTT